MKTKARFVIPLCYVATKLVIFVLLARHTGITTFGYLQIFVGIYSFAHLQAA